MDICLIKTQEGSLIKPSTIHGMLWLQTHFESANWEAIAKNQVLIPNDDAKTLTSDAIQAGIKLSSLPAFSTTGKF